MRFPNDLRLAENAVGIDLILGGHDHVYDCKHVSHVMFNVWKILLD
jgi:5'-nucleotidase